MIGCLQTRVGKQPIIVLYFESETVLTEARFLSTLALQETGTLHTMWRYSDRIAALCPLTRELNRFLSGSCHYTMVLICNVVKHCKGNDCSFQMNYKNIGGSRHGTAWEFN